MESVWSFHEDVSLVQDKALKTKTEKQKVARREFWNIE